MQTVRVIVYSGGKSGSTSLYEGLRTLVGKLCIQVHSNAAFKLIYRSARTLNQLIADSASSSAPLYIISAYREPIGRHISSFFHNISQHTKLPLDRVLQMSTEQLLPYFLACLEMGIEDYHPHTEDKNVGGFGDINIYMTPFDKHKGAQVYSSPRGLVVVMLRFDRIDEWQTIIRNDTPFGDFVMPSSNQAKSKATAELQQRFLQEFKVPKTLLAKAFDRDKRNLEYFMTADEIQEIQTKWYAHAV